EPTGGGTRAPDATVAPTSDDTAPTAPVATTGAGPVDDARSGGRVTLAFANPASCIDPHQLADALTITVARQFTDSLTFQDPATGEILPALATSRELGDDGTTYTFHLQERVTLPD